MRSLLKARYVRIAGVALAAVAVGGIAIAITASAAGMSFGLKPSSSSASPTPTKPGSAPASTVCSDFMSHFATDIGKSQAQIDAAFQKAIGETLADEVKSGQITQAQADAIKAKLAKQTPCTLAPTTAPKGGTGTRRWSSLYMQYYLSAAAASLGLKDEQLAADLKSGESLSQIAAAQNPPVTEAEFRTRVIANLRPVLDKSVSNKLLTAEQEQTILNGLQTGPLPLW
ncbi:MAG TPA: hypothetical protein VHQ03_09945, partial [Candidatus Dormibacteraeota bacterium]|nr:hypothetical protein [Candidatus Dormibacteraeota bacterium]